MNVRVVANSNYPLFSTPCQLSVSAMSFTSSLPDGALRISAPTRQCNYCAFKGGYQADYGLKYVYSGGVFHSNCHSELQLLDVPFAGSVGGVDALFGSTPTASWGLLASTDVCPCRDRSASDNDSFCDSHLAVFTG